MSDPASHEATVTIEQTVRIAASPSTVWSFWMDPELLTEWWARAAEVVPEAGGLYRIHMNEGPTMRGEFLELDPPHRLVFSFGWEQFEPDQPLAPGTSRVEVTLTPDGDDTVLTLRHFDMPSSRAADHTQGWKLIVGERLVAAVAATGRAGA